MSRAPRPDVLILTATVTPPKGAVQLARVDPAQRLEDYRTALGFYLSLLRDGTISKVVFADNSNSDLSVLRALAKERGVESLVEFLPFDGLEYPPAYGRGYGEFRLLDHVMEQSHTIRDARGDTPIWKITGRYVLRNFPRIVRSRPPDADFYCHCRNHPMRWIDLYVLAWTKQGHREVLSGICEHLREDRIGGSAETAFRRIVDVKRPGLNIVKRFRTLPRLEGYRGVDGRRYEEMDAKYVVRRVAHVVAPWLWI